MSGRAFFDSNMLVYVYDAEAGVKKLRVREALVATALPIVSTQVLSEVSNVCLRKMKLVADEVLDILLEIQRSLAVHTNTIDTIEQAVSLQKRYSYSFYDSLILSATLEARCEILYSEDMAHNQLIEDRLRIVNPFL